MAGVEGVGVGVEPPGEDKRAGRPKPLTPVHCSVFPVLPPTRLPHTKSAYVNSGEVSMLSPSPHGSSVAFDMTFFHLSALHPRLQEAGRFAMGAFRDVCAESGCLCCHSPSSSSGAQALLEQAVLEPSHHPTPFPGPSREPVLTED